MWIPGEEAGGCNVHNLPPKKVTFGVEGLLSGGRLYKEKVEGEKLPAADVGGGGEEGEDEDDGVEEVPASKLCFNNAPDADEYDLHSST